MSSSSPAIPPRSPKRTTPKRSPLQEYSKSQTNETSFRVARDTRNDQRTNNIFASTPFPTKPAHVLLPSTIRRQQNNQSSASELPSSSSTSSIGGESLGSPPSLRRPAVKLKRSVKALRDLYEAQAEDTSRPTTATSPALRPSSSSSRLRRFSSSDGLSGRFEWEKLYQISSDDLALLPSLSEAALTVKKIGSKSSFTSRAAKPAAPSSPNYRIHNVSSPRVPVYKDGSSSTYRSDPPTSPSSNEQSSSSPNVIRLGRSPSIEDLHATDNSSSPNVIRLAPTSSPARATTDFSSPVVRRHSSSLSLQRRRADSDQDRAFMTRPFPSSPPYARQSLSSSPDQASSPMGQHISGGSEAVRTFQESSPIFRVLARDDSSSSTDSISEAHANLQDILSSSPGPPIQYPIVRAPSIAEHTLNIPKRTSRGSGSGPESQTSSRFTSRLSAVPSLGSAPPSKSSSRKSSFVEDIDELYRDGAAFLDEPTNNSQIRIITDADQHEATDEVSALPNGDYGYRSPPLRPMRSLNYMCSPNSSQSHLNSLRNSIDSRINGMKPLNLSRSNSNQTVYIRPQSSSSTLTTIAVPVWAQRYYSGNYRELFHHLYLTNANAESQMNVSSPPKQIYNPTNQIYSPTKQRLSPTKLNFSPLKDNDSRRRFSLTSYKSYKNSISEHVPAIFRPRNRPRLEARKSHLLPGVGPLVSNPVRPPATAALQSRNSLRGTISVTSLHSAYNGHQNHVRPMSFPLHPSDPRAHWKGTLQIPGGFNAEDGSHYEVQHSRHVSADGSVICYSTYRTGRLPSVSPHLHHDRRLNTGSTASRGYGFPFNRKTRWSAPGFGEEPFRPAFGPKGRHFQFGCFIIGFIFPLSWLIAALLPLPPRPESFHDLEKAKWQQQQQQRSHDLQDWDEMDVIAQLRLEKHIKGVEELRWQNARWWRTLNRWMCLVGCLILILMIVLAVIGTRQGLN